MRRLAIFVALLLFVPFIPTVFGVEGCSTDADCQVSTTCDGGQSCVQGVCTNNPDAPQSTPCEADGNPCTQDHCDGEGNCGFLQCASGSCAEGFGECIDCKCITSSPAPSPSPEPSPSPSPSPFPSPSPSPGPSNCGNGFVDFGEECDDGNTDDGDGCSSICLLEKNVNFALFDLALDHNMLFSKVMDLLHIIKDSLFQMEIKIIEIQLTNSDCDKQPVSFWLPGNLPYGKLHEIDKIIADRIRAIEKGQAMNPNAFNNIPNLQQAKDFLSFAKGCKTSKEFKKAFNCDCKAYKALLGKTDTTVPECQPCLT